MTRLVPVQLDNNTVIYIEATDDSGAIAPPTPAAEDTGEQRRIGQKGISLMPPRPDPLQSMQMVQNTIRAYALYSLNAFKNLGAANVEEVTLEFGVNLSADAGIPYIASGKAQSNLKITVKCSYKEEEEEKRER